MKNTCNKKKCYGIIANSEISPEIGLICCSKNQPDMNPTFYFNIAIT